jgi:hypothetical protein
MVANLLEFKAKLDNILTEAFSRSDALANSTKENFEQFINTRYDYPHPTHDAWRRESGRTCS